MSKKEESKQKQTEKGKEIDGLMDQGTKRLTDRQSVLLSQQSVMGRFNNWKEQYMIQHAQAMVNVKKITISNEVYFQIKYKLQFIETLENCLSVPALKTCLFMKYINCCPIKDFVIFLYLEIKKLQHNA